MTLAYYTYAMLALLKVTFSRWKDTWIVKHLPKITSLVAGLGTMSQAHYCQAAMS
jgi:hypothetical protein